jgi:8-oxo-dGTP pyrophosphatase MutT (NUDIX family)
VIDRLTTALQARRQTPTAPTLAADQYSGRRSARHDVGSRGWQNAPVSISAEDSARARIVTALLRDGDRVLLCHRTPQRRWYPDVWDLPGGHVEPGELAGLALARELREELGIDIAAPLGPPVHEVRADTFDMQIWLIEAWTGSPVNVAPDEHDAIAWFTEDALGDLSLAHDSYLAMFSRVLAEYRA